MPACYKIGIAIVLFSLGISVNRASCQTVALERGSQAFTDSIGNRIDHLEKQIARLKQTRDVAYLNMQRELDHTLFIKAYYEYVTDEDLDPAKSLVETRIERSEFRRDQASVKFYRTYEEHIYALIKDQRMRYQQLFQKEKNFKKEFERYIEPGTAEAYRKAQRIVDLALKYARENNLTETIKYLTNYRSFTEALIFDLGSEYDLAELTNNAKSFEKAFQPLISSDSLESIREAEHLLAHCINYGRLTNSSLDGEYFRKQEMAVTAALSELFDREGREKELAHYTNQAVIAKYDSLNPCGVFKWHDQIVVIDEFIPSSAMENVKKGEAIIHADRMLATYLQKNKLCQSIKDLRFGYAFIIPYQSNAKNTAFYYNRSNQKWQFIACYTLVDSKDYTLKVSKYMPPLFFEDEMNTVDAPVH
ncbi:MAG: hypothetical protein JXA72_12080 [Bacteroidales bacterium]|nr:hypothetical protein [Bacteroidales bacterium]